ncbi:MAG TPA: UDP-N-acetylglucosamine--N-acetylmuramyl-(pentapeptide) pyrophosphoryl-undecaprenol N-acetylglucosamine transferase [Gemmatimonadales bacterium]|nr:UDP-N-acetylglucosamine--N-acetylmuramyl-(pentapeptide) pyrophosphoryl-undecaprenol N-acetylglucosamine transferase [Gemmatimonadales bacterium]
MTTVLFTGGGTGGHLMPALAIAEEMVRLDPAVRPFFVGSRRGVEATVLPHRPWRYELLPLEPLWRRRWWRNLRLPFALAASLREVRALLAREAPVAVVGTGGYVAGPVVWAAMNRGVPAVLQEQNAFPGLVTRTLARRARQVHLGFPEARARLAVGQGTAVFDSGNPIPAPPSPRPSRADAKRKLGFPADRPLVFVTGGSQGALAINEAVAAALASGTFPRGASLLWQCGARSLERFAPLRAPGRVVVEAFLDPVSDAHAAADLVVSRAGAMTLAGLAVWGLPAILVPLPTAAAGHQLSNARALAQAGAATLVDQSGLSGDTLSGAVATLLDDPARMADLGRRMLARARPDAAATIAAEALKLVPKA